MKTYKLDYFFETDLSINEVADLLIDFAEEHNSFIGGSLYEVDDEGNRI